MKGLKILVVRRDNIGDLVLTTPLFAGLRARFPDAWIGALANSYNAPVLAGNPDIDRIFAYRKLKHREPDDGLVGSLWSRVRLVAELRRHALDYAVLAGESKRSLAFARAFGAKQLVGFDALGGGLDIAVPLGDTSSRHEVEITWQLASAFGIEGPPPAPRVVPEASLVEEIRSKIGAALPGGGPLIALHISARKPGQRWPVGRFSELIAALQQRRRARFVLLWAPGDANNPMHPGDDESAKELLAQVARLPVLAAPTTRLPDLIAAISACDQFLGADGGAMHIAAALGKPVLCFFGNSSASRWRPWGVRHFLLQPASRQVKDIRVVEALAAYERLAAAGGERDDR